MSRFTAGELDEMISWDRFQHLNSVILFFNLKGIKNTRHQGTTCLFLWKCCPQTLNTGLFIYFFLFTSWPHCIPGTLSSGLRAYLAVTKPLQLNSWVVCSLLTGVNWCLPMQTSSCVTSIYFDVYCYSRFYFMRKKLSYEQPLIFLKRKKKKEKTLHFYGLKQQQ